MLLLSRPEGDNIQTLMEHLDKHGTPEVLNKLYHPKHASKPPDNTPILKRIESLLSKTPRKEGTDG